MVVIFFGNKTHSENIMEIALGFIEKEVTTATKDNRGHRRGFCVRSQKLRNLPRFRIF